MTEGKATGQRKFMSILFADIQGSTAIAGQVDPEDWYLALERFHVVATMSVREFHGVVTQYAGDGIMALFGAPVADELHATQAGYAALAVIDRMATVADELAPLLGTELGVRIGLNSGEAVVGRIGLEGRVDYTAQGISVHIAARMEQAAGVGQIFITPDTLRLLDGRFETEPMGDHELKGVDGLFPVHRLLGVAPVIPTSANSGLPFVGRQTELDRLTKALDRASAGKPTVVGLIGNGGCGKSRLLRTFLDQATVAGAKDNHALAEDALIVEADRVSLPRPMWGVSRLLRRILNLQADSAADLAEIRAALAGLAQELAKYAEPVRSILEYASFANPGNPDLQRRIIASAVHDIVAAALAKRSTPLIVAIDDLHALDDASRSVMSSLIENCPPGPLLLVAASRPTETSEDWFGGADDLISVNEFTLGEIEALVKGWFESDESAQFAAMLHERTGGNAFFAGEVLRSLSEEGALVGEVGSARLVAAPEDLNIPPQIYVVVASRIDRLDRQHKDLLFSASVLDVEFDLGVLADIVQAEPATVGGRLDKLIEADLLVALDSDRYSFAHRTTQEVAYQSQLRSRRQSSHAAAAQAIAASSESETLFALIGHHHEKAGEERDACAWYEKGARSAAAVDPGEAVRLWSKVRDLTVAADDESTSQAMTARAEILGQGARTGLSEEQILATIDEARTLAGRSSGQAAMLALVLLRGWYALSSVGLPHLARASSHEAIATADSTEIAMLSVGARLAELANYASSRPAADGIQLCDETEELVRKHDLDGPASMFRYQLDFSRASIMVRQGEVDPAVALLESSVLASDAAGDNMWRVVSRVGLVVGLSAQSNVGAVERVAAEALAIANESGGNGEISSALRGVGLAALAVGDYDAAVTNLTEALEMARESLVLITEELIIAGLADAHRLAGDLTSAISYAQEGIGLATERESEVYELMSQLSLARALLAKPEGVWDLSDGEVSQSKTELLARTIDRASELIDRNGVDLYATELATIIDRQRGVVSEAG